MLSAGAAKLGVTALCVAGAAGSYAVCSQGNGIDAPRPPVPEANSGRAITVTAMTATAAPRVDTVFLMRSGIGV
jgi:hypothetical protein